MKTISFKGIISTLIILILFLSFSQTITAQTEPTPWAVHNPVDVPYTRPTTPVQRPTAKIMQPTSSDPYIVDLIQHLNETLLLGYLQNLTSFGPRVTGTTNCTAAAAYLYATFQTMGLSVRYRNWTDGSLSASNIEATLPGTSTGPLLIVCGHYDSVPTSPGADDDGSGVATVLAAAHLLKDAQLNHTVRFVCFSGEEQGLIGSHYYAEDQALHNVSILAALNADMIAYTETHDDGLLGKIYYDDASQWICNYAANISLLYDPYIGIQVVPSGYTWGSDHNSFWDYGYQAIFCHEFKFNAYYHSSNDTIAHMNLTYHAHFARLILATLIDLAAQPHPILTLTSIKGGLGCTATITNTGDAPATNPSLNIEISPGAFHLYGASSGTTFIVNLQPGETVTQRCISLGIGTVDITITATAENLSTLTRTATAFELGPFLLKLTVS